MPPTNPPKFCMARYQRARSRAPPCGSAEGEFQSLMKMVREEHLHHMGGCDVKSKPEFQIAFPYNGNRRSFVFQLDRPDVYSGSVCMRILYSDVCYGLTVSNFKLLLSCCISLEDVDTSMIRMHIHQT